MIIHQIKVAAEVPPVLKNTRHHMMTDRILTAVHKSHYSIQRFKVRIIAVIESTVVVESTSG